MRTVIIDQFEFENPSTEERLEVTTARRSDFPFPNLSSFAGAHGFEGVLPDAVPFSDLPGSQSEIGYLRRYAGIEVFEPCLWACRELPSGHDGRHLLLETEDGFISYKWSTSA